MTTKYGVLIALEGLDGSGKTTLINHLAQYYKSHGLDVIQTAEPGGTPFGRQLREILLSETGAALSHTTQALLLAAARRHHVETVIQPALAQGQIILCDRFTLSTRVYQPECAAMDTLINLGARDIAPDLTLVLDIDYATARQRLATRNGVDLNHFDKAHESLFNIRRGILNDWVGKNLGSCTRIRADHPTSIVQETAEMYINDLLTELNLFTPPTA